MYILVVAISATPDRTGIQYERPGEFAILPYYKRSG